ncbi:MAG: DUF2877 domain-containing protein [Acidimicrobiia bacterium]|nr:DUF2877 domain-containing protein [Acidimicrobiia bacterium]
MLTGPVQAATLLGVSDHAAWMGTGDEAIVVSDRAAVRLPNALELAVEELGRWIGSDDAVSVGDGMIRVGSLTAQARRWFDPRPSLGRCEKSQLRTNLERLRLTIGPVDGSGLLEALTDEDAEAVLSSSLMLLGKGEGLTPEGDDVVAGALASHLLLGGALGRHLPYFERLIRPLDDLTRTRTTSFSGALIRHALRGRVALPFAQVLCALTGRGDLTSATNRLIAVGHSSGAALAAGLWIGGSALTRENDS